MIKESSEYKSHHLALIIPTKDRPFKVKNLLDSILIQTVKCGRIIVIDGGDSIEHILIPYMKHLSLEYYECRPAGQIRQRNLAISKLNSNTPIVLTLDDDIVLFPDTLEKGIDFFNNCPKETAAVSLNIVNCTSGKHNFLKALMGISSSLQGIVLKSGVNTSISSVSKNIQTKWVCGGATIWRSEVLKTYSNKIQDSLWASSEDLAFSYPIGKLYPMFVCADSKVKHEHLYDANIKKKFIFYGKTETLWRFYFVESHVELSRLYFIWSQACTIVARFIKGTYTLNNKHFQFAIGQLLGLFKGFSVIIGKKNIDLMLREN
jgi:glycosyltransferase involved in cell wall biosynthesis